MVNRHFSAPELVILILLTFVFFSSSYRSLKHPPFCGVTRGSLFLLFLTFISVSPVPLPEWH